MPDDLVTIFESTDGTLVRAVESALRHAEIACEVPRMKLTLAQMGPNKPPQPVVVAPGDAEAARQIVRDVLHRRERIASMPPPKPAPDNDRGPPDPGFFGGF